MEVNPVDVSVLGKQLDAAAAARPGCIFDEVLEYWITPMHYLYETGRVRALPL